MKDAIHAVIRCCPRKTPFGSRFVWLILLLTLGFESSLRAQFLYTKRGGEVIITGYTGAIGEVVIPDMLDGLRVTQIGANAFQFKRTLTKISIPNSVTSIGKGAFSACSGLTSMTIPNSVTFIGDDAFNYCTGLTSLIIPNSVSFIGTTAFGSCSGLTNVTIPNSITSISTATFKACSGLTSIKIPNTITSIGNGAFAACSGLTNVAIPHSVTELGAGSFDECSRLTSVVIPSSITSIGESTFRNCTRLIKILMPPSITSIGSSAFYGCTSLAIVTIPNNVTFVGEYAFTECSGLTKVLIGNSVSHIGWNAFSKCTKLTEIYFRGNPPTLEPSVFDSTSVTLYYLWWNIKWPNTFGGLSTKAWSDIYPSDFDYAQTGGGITIFGYNGSENDISIPRTLSGLPVTRIADFAFKGNSGVTSITIPNSITSIGEEAFAQGISLTRVIIPKSVTSIGKNAFYGCTKLTSVEFRGDAPMLGFGTFDFTPVTAYYLPWTSGWSRTFGGRPAKLWPGILTDESKSNPQAGDFHSTLSGVAGVSVVVEACDNMKTQSWLPVGTNTFNAQGRAEFSDAAPSGVPMRFYRFRAQ